MKFSHLLTYLLVRLLETMYLKVYLLAQILEQSKNLKNTFEGFIKRQRNPDIYTEIYSKAP